MIVKIFGFMDFLAGISFFLLKFGRWEGLAWICVVYLLIKGIIFIGDISSVLDLIGVFFFILAIYGFYTTFSWIFVLWFLQKGFFSLFS